jgi:hypothetical protein
MKTTLEKYKHNTTGKFHVIKLMLDNIEKGGIDPTEGFGSIHETVLKITNSSKVKFQEYSKDILVVTKNKNDLIVKTNFTNLSSLRSLEIGGMEVTMLNFDRQHIYFVFLEDFKLSPIYLIGKLLSQLAIKMIFIEKITEEMKTIFAEEKIEIISSFEDTGLQASDKE